MTYADYLRSSHWQDLRALKLAANPRCERCNERHDLEVHHRHYRRSWFLSRLSDLETLCHSCHSFRHLTAGKPHLARAITDFERYRRPKAVTPFHLVPQAKPIFKPSEKTAHTLFPWLAEWPTHHSNDQGSATSVSQHMRESEANTKRDGQAAPPRESPNPQQNAQPDPKPASSTTQNSSPTFKPRSKP